LLALGWAHSVAAYLLLNLVAAAALAVGGWAWLRRDLAAARGLWSRPAVKPGLQLGWTMMPVSLAGAAYSLALPAVASAQMSRSELGLYYLADRIVRSVLAAADPVFQLVYPRIVARWALGARAAWAYAGKWALLGVVAGCMMLLAGVVAVPLAAPLLARSAAGADMAHLPDVMRVLGGLLPLLLGWKFLGYCMLGSGRHDRAYRLCVVVGGAFGLVAALHWAGQGAVTLAWVALAVECVVIATAVAGMAFWREPRAA
jgi:O-antigen/teichoic acid export membrane protein